MKTLDFTPADMEKRIARVDRLKPNKAEFLERSGLPPEAYEHISAKSIFLLMAKPKEASKSNSQPAIDGPAGASIYVVETPAKDGPVLHAHMRTWETFMPLTGRYRFDYGRDGKHAVIVEPFELISVPPGVIRKFTNVEDHTARMMVIIQGEDDGAALNDITMPPSVGEEIARRWGGTSRATLESMGYSFDADLDEAKAAE